MVKSREKEGGEKKFDGQGASGREKDPINPRGSPSGSPRGVRETSQKKVKGNGLCQQRTLEDHLFDRKGQGKQKYLPES